MQQSTVQTRYGKHAERKKEVDKAEEGIAWSRHFVCGYKVVFARVS